MFNSLQQKQLLSLQWQTFAKTCPWYNLHHTLLELGPEKFQSFVLQSFKIHICNNLRTQQLHCLHCHAQLNIKQFYNIITRPSFSMIPLYKRSFDARLRILSRLFSHLL